MQDGWIWAEEELLVSPLELAWDDGDDDDDWEDDLDEDWDDDDLEDEDWDEDDEEDEDWEEWEEEFEEDEDEPSGRRRSGRQEWN